MNIFDQTTTQKPSLIQRVLNRAQGAITPMGSFLTKQYQGLKGQTKTYPTAAVLKADISSGQKAQLIKRQQELAISPRKRIGELGTMVSDQIRTSLVEEPKDPIIESIRSVFGESWQPASVFSEKDLTEKGIYGAVRIEGSPDVYTIGPGGRLETPESYQAKFGTLEQKDIVGIVTSEQATSLGITPEKAPSGLFDREAFVPEDYDKEPDVEMPDITDEEEKLTEEEVIQIIKNPKDDYEKTLSSMFKDILGIFDLDISKTIPRVIMEQALIFFVFELARKPITYLYREYFESPERRGCREAAEMINEIFGDAWKDDPLDMSLSGAEKEKVNRLTDEMEGCDEAGYGYCGFCRGEVIEPGSYIPGNLEKLQEGYKDFQEAR